MMPSTPFWLNAMLLASTATAMPAKRQTGNTVELKVVNAPSSPVNAPFTDKSQSLYVELTLDTSTIWSNLDTGSSNLVVFSQKAAYAQAKCPFNDATMCKQLTYDGNAPRVAGEDDSQQQKYGDGEGGYGNFRTGTLNFEGDQLDNFEFFQILTDNTLSSSVFGTGYTSNEGANKPYPNLPLALTNANKINAPIFSLWTNGIRGTSTGSMLYGGVDNKKFCGTLAPLPVQKEGTGASAQYREFNVLLTAATTTDNSGNAVDIGIPAGSSALLDSGTNSFSLPHNAYLAVTKAYGATLPAANSRNFPQVDCGLADAKRSITINFGDFTISVPSTQFISQGDAGDSCALYVSDNGASSQVILGTPFLSSVYVVYDLRDNNVYLAQSINDATASNVIAVNPQSNPVAIPPEALIGSPCSGSTTTTTTTTTTMKATTTTTSMTTTSTKTTTSASASTTSNSSGTTTSSAKASSTSSGMTTTSSAKSSSSSSSMTTSSSKASSTSSGMTTSSGMASSTSSGMTTSSGKASSTSSGVTTSSGTASTTSGMTTSSSKASSTSSGVSTSGSTTSTSSYDPGNTSTSTSTASQSTSTWAQWNLAQSSSSSSSSTWNTWSSATPSQTTTSWNNWAGNPSSSWTTSAVTSPATWSSWAATATGLSYSTVTTTIYVCPASNWNCGNAKTATVTTTVVPYTTSTVWSTSTVTITAACGAWSSCTGSYTTTSTTVVASTTVCPYTPAATSASWTAVTGNGVNTPAAASTWAAVATGASPAAASTWASWTGSSTGAAASASWTGVPIATYKGAASSMQVGAMTLMGALVGSMLLVL